MTPIDLDDFDRRIIARLLEDVRVSNRQIAREFGLTEGTIRMRLKRLLDSGAISFTALVNSSRIGRRLAFLWIDAASRRDVPQVLTALERIEGIVYTSTMFGRSDLLALTMFDSREELDRLGHEEVNRIPGIAKVTRSICEEFIKHDHLLFASVSR